MAEQEVPEMAAFDTPARQPPAAAEKQQPQTPPTFATIRPEAEKTLDGESWAACLSLWRGQVVTEAKLVALADAALRLLSPQAANFINDQVGEELRARRLRAPAAAPDASFTGEFVRTEKEKANPFLRELRKAEEAVKALAAREAVALAKANLQTVEVAANEGRIQIEAVTSVNLSLMPPDLAAYLRQVALRFDPSILVKTNNLLVLIGMTGADQEEFGTRLQSLTAPLYYSENSLVLLSVNRRIIAEYAGTEVTGGEGGEARIFARASGGHNYWLAVTQRAEGAFVDASPVGEAMREMRARISRIERKPDNPRWSPSGKKRAKGGAEEDEGQGDAWRVPDDQWKTWPSAAKIEYAAMRAKYANTHTPPPTPPSAKNF